MWINEEKVFNWTIQYRKIVCELYLKQKKRNYCQLKENLKCDENQCQRIF